MTSALSNAPLRTRRRARALVKPAPRNRVLLNACAREVEVRATPRMQPLQAGGAVGVVRAQRRGDVGAEEAGEPVKHCEKNAEV